LSYTDKERYENEERPEVQKQMLVDMAKKLPVYTRTGSGGQFIQSHLKRQLSKNLRKTKSSMLSGYCLFLPSSENHYGIFFSTSYIKLFKHISKLGEL
jgi:hypothetical protein